MQGLFCLVCRKKGLRTNQRNWFIDPCLPMHVPRYWEPRSATVCSPATRWWTRSRPSHCRRRRRPTHRCPCWRRFSPGGGVSSRSACPWRWVTRLVPPGGVQTRRTTTCASVMVCRTDVPRRQGRSYLRNKRQVSWRKFMACFKFFLLFLPTSSVLGPFLLLRKTRTNTTHPCNLHWMCTDYIFFVLLLIFWHVLKLSFSDLASYRERHADTEKSLDSEEEKYHEDAVQTPKLRGLSQGNWLFWVFMPSEKQDATSSNLERKHHFFFKLDNTLNAPERSCHKIFYLLNNSNTKVKFLLDSHILMSQIQNRQSVCWFQFNLHVSVGSFCFHFFPQGIFQDKLAKNHMCSQQTKRKMSRNKD